MTKPFAYFALGALIQSCYAVRMDENVPILSQVSSQNLITKSKRASTKMSAQCNPIQVGELRVKSSKQCVDIAGSEGVGGITTHDCDGGKDQQIILCEDGTIRNAMKNYCFTTHGQGQLTSSICEFTGSSASQGTQLWKKGKKKQFVDNGGITQTAFELKNAATDQCMDVAGYGGRGIIGLFACESVEDQLFYFRSRGKALGTGQLIVEESNQCVDVNGQQGNGAIYAYNCEGTADQAWTYYSNGEIVNQLSNLCLEVDGTSGDGLIYTHFCEDAKDQMWDTPQNLQVNGHDSFQNRKSKKCMDVANYDGYGRISTYQCEGLSDQRFYFQKNEFITPDVTWFQIHCNMNGPIQLMIQSSTSYTNEITFGVSRSIGASIEAGCTFGSATASTEFTTSLSQAWSNTYSESMSVTVSCANYDNGEEFSGGCLWQLKMETQDTKGQFLTWKPSITRCTKTNVAPKCPPFTICADQSCTFCKAV